MRFAALLLISMAMVATAAAQTSPARFEFLPIPNTLPTLLFAPDPLAGTLLAPFIEPKSDSTLLLELMPEPAVLPVAVAQPLPVGSAAEAVLAPVAEPGAEALPGATGGAVLEPAPEMLPDATGGAVLEPALEAPPATVEPPVTTVTVIVENVESGAGTVNVAVCDTGLSREGCPYVQEVPAALGFVETEFEGIPPGTYAIVGYHDVNGNDLFDKILGMPREPYALSNNAGDKLVPTFDDASLPIRSGENAVIIRLQRLGS